MRFLRPLDDRLEMAVTIAAHVLEDGHPSIIGQRFRPGIARRPCRAQNPASRLPCGRRPGHHDSPAPMTRDRSPFLERLRSRARSRVRAPALVLGMAASFLIVTGPLAASQGAPPARSSGPELVVSWPASREYHRPWCSLVRTAKEAVVRSRADAEARGLTSHKACATPPKAAEPDVEPLWLDVKTHRYHRAGCWLIGAPRTRITLDVATAKRYQPCRACKPPRPLSAVKPPTASTPQKGKSLERDHSLDLRPRGALDIPYQGI